jgi:broad specificity phosphatase PhoE
MAADTNDQNTYFLIRHGEALTNALNVASSLGGEREYPLTERGRRQISETADFLRSMPPDFIVASPILRARESATLLAEALGLPLSFDVRLCEPTFGSFEGKDITSFFEFMAEHGGRNAGAPEIGIEGYMDIRARVRSFLAAVRNTFTEQKIAIVSHADVLQEVYADFRGEPVGAEQSGKWFPEKGSCLVVRGQTVLDEFIPKN